MTLNGVMAVTLRYFNEFGKRAFQLITASSSIELIDQESTSITHIERCLGRLSLPPSVGR